MGFLVNRASQNVPFTHGDPSLVSEAFEIVDADGADVTIVDNHFSRNRFLIQMVTTAVKRFAVQILTAVSKQTCLMLR